MFFELPSLASEPLNNKSNETVSVGHTAVSPHTLGGGVEGTIILGYSKLKVPSSGKLLIFGRGGILG